MLKDSQLIQEMIPLQTPCNDIVYCPANLVILGTQGKCSVFKTMSYKSGTAYIAIAQPPGRVRFHLEGALDFISEIYENIPWLEVKMKDGNEMFNYKKAPSLQELEEYFKQFEK